MSNISPSTFLMKSYSRRTGRCPPDGSSNISFARSAIKLKVGEREAKQGGVFKRQPSVWKQGLSLRLGRAAVSEASSFWGKKSSRTRQRSTSNYC